LQNWSNQDTYFRDDTNAHRTTPPDIGARPGAENPPRGSVLARGHLQNRGDLRLLILVIIVAGIFAIKPEWTNIITRKVSNALGNPETGNASATMTQAKFVTWTAAFR